MDIVQFIVTYLAALIVFLVIDFTWLGFIAQKLYSQELGHLLSTKANGSLQPKWLPAVIFYLLFVFGLLVLVVLPGLETASLQTTLLKGALYGLVTYATYDLTNLATLRDWSLKITLIDLAWGTILSTVVTFAAYTVGAL